MLTEELGWHAHVTDDEGSVLLSTELPSSLHTPRMRAFARVRTRTLALELNLKKVVMARGARRTFFRRARSAPDFLQEQSRRPWASGSVSSRLSVLFSICRMRSRVTPKALPTSSSVHG